MKEKLKVGINGRPFCNSSIRGLARHTLELIEHLHLAHPEVEIYIYTYGKIHQIFRERLSYVKFRESNPFIKIFWDLWLLPKALREDEILLFHSTNNLGLPFYKKIKKIVTIHDDLTHRHRMTLSLKNIWGICNYFIEMYLLKKSNAFITVSETAKEDIVKTMKIPAEKIQVIYNGITIPALDNSFIREDFYLYVGGLDERKNIAYLIVELESAQKKLNRPIHLVLVSQINSASVEVKAKIKSSSLSISIREQISDEELNVLYQKSRLLINPSLYEGFGLPVIEAMLRKTPVVISNLKVFEEITQNNAFFFSPTIVGSLSQLITKLENKEIDLHYYIENGFKLAKRYTASNMAEETFKIYQQILTQKSL